LLSCSFPILTTTEHSTPPRTTLKTPAGIMRNLTGKNLPNKVPAVGRPGEFIEHQYLHIR